MHVPGGLAAVFALTLLQASCGTVEPEPVALIACQVREGNLGEFPPSDCGVIKGSLLVDGQLGKGRAVRLSGDRYSSSFDTVKADGSFLLRVHRNWRNGPPPVPDTVTLGLRVLPSPARNDWTSPLAVVDVVVTFAPLGVIVDTTRIRVEVTTDPSGSPSETSRSGIPSLRGPE